MSNKNEGEDDCFERKRVAFFDIFARNAHRVLRYR